MLSDWIKNLCSRLSGRYAGEPDPVLPENGGGRGSIESWRGAKACPVDIGSLSAVKWLWLALFLVSLVPAQAISSVQGDKIVNRAVFSSLDTAPVSAAVTATVVVRTLSTIEFNQYAPGIAGATDMPVTGTAYRSGSSQTAPFASVALPIPVGSQLPIDLSKAVPLLQTRVFHAGEPLFIKVTDLDQNLDRTKGETILVTITEPKTGDREVIRLTESGPDTGVFIGYLPTTAATVEANNGALSVVEGSAIEAHYVDVVDGNDVSAAAILVDPFGIVFDSLSGNPVNGAQVALIDVSTGLPAVVLGDDGVSSYPSTLTAGGTASDTSGRVYDFPPGGFRFPFLNPGTYQLKVTPPPAFVAPSTASDAALRDVPGGPFTIAVPGSRGEPFVINAGPAIRIDIPLDPLFGTLWVRKTAGKGIVSAGEFLPYDLLVDNNDPVAPVAAVKVIDTLPKGFRYQKGSAKINGAVAADPAISADGRTMTFALGTLEAKSSTVIRYVVEVSAGAVPGKAVNTVTAASTPAVTVNTASATVLVQEAFLRSKSILMGRVIADGCSDNIDEAAEGVEGVSIYMEDGTFAVSDKRGMFHFEGVSPGTHVVQLDIDSLPEGYRITACEENTRFAGRAFSQFVDVKGGTMWRVDFHAERKDKLPKSAATERGGTKHAGAGSEIVQEQPAPAGEVSLEMNSTVVGRSVDYSIAMKGTTVPLSKMRLSVTLPAGVTYQPGSSRLDGDQLADPTISGTTLAYDLADSAGDWSRGVGFQATVDRSLKGGELRTSAVLTCDAPGGADIPTPAAENLLNLTRDETSHPLPPIVLNPHFPTFGAELDASDRQMLDELARLLMALKPESIDVVGHTDNVRIAPRARKIYRDNVALSHARARSVGRYLMNALHLSPDKLTFAGMGEAKPVADNRTAAGRAQNRRVEIRVMAKKVVESSRIENVKDKSGLQKVEALALPGDESSAAPVVKSAETAAVDQPVEKKVAPEPKKSVEEKEGILSPADGSSLATKINAVRICLAARLTPRLTVDGKEVSRDRIGFTMADRDSGKTIYSYIGIDLGDAGQHVIKLEGLDPFGNVRFERRATISRAGEIASIRFVSADGNIADGKTPVRVRVQLLDAEGKQINANAELGVKDGNLHPASPDQASATGANAQTVQVDANGWVSFPPTTTSGQYRAVLVYNKATLEVETYVKPKMRDNWILVGLAEGTAGYNAVSGHIESFRTTGTDEDLYKDGRIAFYAKGSIKGEWLLTMAYDTAKKSTGSSGNSLFQTIDPNTYYTLYGDGTQQSYDAASARKLYLKIERDQFYALFGDFDTGLTVTELSRYSRRLNGLKTELQSKNLEFNMFGSETSQAFVKDEILGDGTSGLYQLSRRNIVLNSEKITIETRDRFRSEVVIASRSLSGYIDYTIDYDAGTIFFKEPVHSKDENFNPIFIVVDYESNDSGDQALNYGGRVGLKLLDQKIKAGVSYIHEGQTGGKGNLYGLDSSVKLTETTRIIGEVATSEAEFGGNKRDGMAYLAELTHSWKQFETKLYVREQDAGFGLGQQMGSETGTRKFGLDAAYRLTDNVSVTGQGYRQYNLVSGAERDMVEAQAKYATKVYSMQLGMRQATDSMGDGSVNRSTQLSAGGSVNLLENRLTLRLTHDQSVFNNSNADFPTRTTLGADYKLTAAVSLFAAQEFTFGALENTRTTVVGLKSTPWQGGQISSAVSQQANENGDRVFANLGMKQSWQITEKWSVDGGLDRSQTLKHPGNYTFNVNVPPASGGTDFTAISLGGNYKEEKWTWSNRLEYRTSDTEDKWGGFSGVIGEVRQGIALSGRAQLFRTEGNAGGEKTNADLRFGLAYRPKLSQWIVLDRLDLIYDRNMSPGADLDSRRIVNNLNASWKPNRRTQLALQYGSKYVRENIDGMDFSGYTDLFGGEARHDLTKSWDLGLHGSVLHSWNSGQFDYGAGASVGYNVMDNAWVSLGYNLTGFEDQDFSRANFTAKGPFIRFRFKFDQVSVREVVGLLNHE
jgi:uncharacterized repeat protein (TIGR01451 family)